MPRDLNDTDDLLDECEWWLEYEWVDEDEVAYMRQLFGRVTKRLRELNGILKKECPKIEEDDASSC